MGNELNSFIVLLFHTYGTVPKKTEVDISESVLYVVYGKKAYGRSPRLHYSIL